MKRLINIFVLVLMLFCGNASISYAQSGVVWCTNCSSEFTQALMNSTSLSQLSELASQVDQAMQQTQQQIQMVQNGANQLQNMVKNTTGLPTSMISKAQGMFSQLTSLTKQLNVNRGDASAMNQIFSATYSSTGAIRSLAAPLKSQAAASGTKLSQEKDTMNDDVFSGQQAAFDASGQNLDDLEQQAADLDQQMSDLMQTPEGQMQAIQAGNQIAAQSLGESQKLRGLLAVSIQANAKKAASDEADKVASKAAWDAATATDHLTGGTSQQDPF